MSGKADLQGGSQVTVGMRGPMANEQDVYRFEYRIGKPEMQLGDFLVMQISDIQTEKLSLCDMHVQVCDEISYIANGRCRYRVNDYSFDAVPGDLVMIRKGDVHEYASDPVKPVRIYNIGLIKIDGQDTDIRDIYEMVYSHNTPVILHDQIEIGRAFTKLFEEGVNAKAYSKYASSLRIKQIILMVYRGLLQERTKEYNLESLLESRQALFYTIVNYMDSNIEDIRLLNNLPSLLHYSYSYLARTFKLITGLSLSAYFRQRRFIHATCLLMNEDISITDIAQRMGYQSVHAFSKAFRKYYGMCPTDYICEDRRMKERFRLVDTPDPSADGALYAINQGER